MAKFQSTHQSDSMNTYRGPSGTDYDSHKGRPFTVTEPKDIAAFRAQTAIFTEIGLAAQIGGAIKEAINPKPAQSQEAELEAFIKQSIPGIAKKTLVKLVNQYPYLEALFTDLDQGGPKDLLTESQLQSLRDAREKVANIGGKV